MPIINCLHRPIRKPLRKAGSLIGTLVCAQLVSLGAATAGASAQASTSLLPAPLPAGTPWGQIALHVLPQTNHGVLLIVAVRIEGQGPYPFALDTGAADSVISSGLAAKFRLPAGPPLDHRAQGAACASAPPGGTTARLALSNWQVGGIRLPATDVVPLAGFGSGTGTIDGLLGSDALSGLSALTVNYRTDRATLGPAPAHPNGQLVNLNVTRNTGEVFPIAPVTIASHQYSFVVDTGASGSAITPSASAQLHLSSLGGESIYGATCSSVVGLVNVAHWRLGAVGLPAGRLLTLNLPYAGLPSPIGNISGLVGSDVLASFGTVTIDYARHRLVLG